MKKTLDEVKKYFIKHGCELLENEYVNAHTKMKYRCCCGQISIINYNNFRTGKRCGCGRVGLHRLKKIEIKKEVEYLGFTFISCSYVNKQNRVKVICKCGLEREAKLKNIRLSEGCLNCRNHNFSFKYQEVFDYFAEQGCKLLEKEYKNARTKLKYICNCGHESSIVFHSFKRGNRCKRCGIEKNSGKNNPCWIEDREKKAYIDLFTKRCRTMLSTVMTSCGIEKQKSTKEILGYTAEHLRFHLESFPSWNILKNQKWDIDHIFPIKAFLDYGIKDLRLINCLENLQPLTRKANRVKSGKYDAGAFESWLDSKFRAKT
jgi:hypothetical protein